MSIVQFSIQIFYTTALLALAGMALACYFALFYLMMIALDGCAICKKLRAHFAPASREQSLTPRS